jgi:SpoVK/Ycf46/Vps4 family AAA+-type ATPase
MDIKEIFKLQMVSQMGHHQSASSNTTQKNMLYQILLMSLMSIIDDATKALPRLFNQAKDKIYQYCTTRVQETIEKPKTLQDLAVTFQTKHFLNTLSMTRTYITDNKSETLSEESNGMIDSVLDQVSKLTNVPTFRLIDKGNTMITYKEKPIQLTKELFFKIDDLNLTPSGNVNYIKFSLQSNTLSAAEITTYVRSLYNNYLQEIKNSLGDNIYFFDQKNKDSLPPQLPPTTDQASINNHRRMMINSAPKQLSFTMSPFYSNKKFSNIYGEEARLIEQRLRFFIENKDWYDAKGIPYQLGILLSGQPGAGKTSIIRAIANLTKRHIVNVNFANITTASQLKNLFYSDKLQVYTDSSMSQTQSYFIPIEKRLYVLEEIDAAGDIVKQRITDPNQNEKEETKTTLNDELTLMEILTVIDGTMEVPGRIMIMTTNHPEVLDAALIRPGRIDVQVSFGNAKKELIAEMYQGYMDRPFPANCIDRLPDKVLSPAEIGQVLFRHFEHPENIDEIIRDINTVAVEKELKLNKNIADTIIPNNTDNIIQNNTNTNAENIIIKDDTLAINHVTLETKYVLPNHHTGSAAEWMQKQRIENITDTAMFKTSEFTPANEFSSIGNFMELS